MREKRWKLILIGIIAVSILAAGYLARERHLLEQQHRTVALSVVYDEVAALARMNGTDTATLLRQFQERGVGTVLIKEPTLREAEQNGEFAVFTGGEMLVGHHSLPGDFMDRLRPELKPDYMYLVTTVQESQTRVAGQLAAKGVQTRSWEQPGLFVLEAGYHNQRLYDQIGLGIPAAALENVQVAGMQPMVQLRSWEQVTPLALSHVIKEVGQIPNLAGILFNDHRLPGYPHEIKTLSYLMQDLAVPLVQIEFNNQLGLSKLGILLDKNMLRLHTITLEEDGKRNFTRAEILDRFALAATERNINVLLLHMYMKPDESSALDYNLALAGDLYGRLQAEGLQVGAATALGSLAASRAVLFVVGLGVIAGGMLLLLALGWGSWAPWLGMLGLLLWTSLLGLGLEGPARKLMAFTAVVVFPTLALVLHLRPRGSTVGQSILLLLRTSLYTGIGALLMVGLLAETGFMLKLDQFTGVKLAHVIPLLLLALYLVSHFSRRNGKVGPGRRYWQELLAQPITVKLALVGGVLLLALLVYVSRTGNESMAISSLELKFRTLLDTVLGVRPRTKEFLLGHPLLLLLFYLGYRNHNYMPLLLLGAIGQISLVNTYAHIHTPLVISLTRSFHGLWLGILGGLVLIALWQLGRRLLQRQHEG